MDHAEQRLTQEMRKALPVIRRIFQQYGPPGFKLEFSAMQEWHNHGLRSLHHSGNAVDVRTRTLPDHGIGVISVCIWKFLQDALDAQFKPHEFTVLLNDQGPTKPHIHVQYNAGARKTTPGDYDEKKRSRLA